MFLSLMYPQAPEVSVSAGVTSHPVCVFNPSPSRSKLCFPVCRLPCMCGVPFPWQIAFLAVCTECVEEASRFAGSGSVFHSVGLVQTVVALQSDTLDSGGAGP